MRLKLGLVAVLIVVIGAVWSLRRSNPPETAVSDREINESGHFVSDSLGVTLYLPQSRGWAFRRDGQGPGSAYIGAVHESGDAYVRLYVSPTVATTTLDTVVEQRRDQWASFFGVPEFDEVIGHVMQERQTEVAGHPAFQWQALSKELGGDDEEPMRVVFLWLATVQPAHVFECVGMLKHSANPLPEERSNVEGLMQDMASIMQSFRVR